MDPIDGIFQPSPGLRLSLYLLSLSFSAWNSWYCLPSFFCSTFLYQNPPLKVRGSQSRTKKLEIRTSLMIEDDSSEEVHFILNLVEVRSTITWHSKWNYESPARVQMQFLTEFSFSFTWMDRRHTVNIPIPVWIELINHIIVVIHPSQNKKTGEGHCVMKVYHWRKRVSVCALKNIADRSVIN